MMETKQDTESYKEEEKNQDWANEKCGGLCALIFTGSRESQEARRQFQYNTTQQAMLFQTSGSDPELFIQACLNTVQSDENYSCDN